MSNMIGAATSTSATSKNASGLMEGLEATEAPSDNADPQEEADEEPDQEQRHDRAEQGADARTDPRTDGVDAEHQRARTGRIPGGDRRTTVRHGGDARCSVCREV